TAEPRGKRVLCSKANAVDAPHVRGPRGLQDQWRTPQVEQTRVSDGGCLQLDVPLRRQRAVPVSGRDVLGEQLIWLERRQISRVVHEHTLSARRTERGGEAGQWY